MSRILDDLRQDHQNFARLWDLLGRELKVFKDGGTPDYNLVENILDYCLNYPELCHHPKEDLVFEKLIECAAVAAKAVGDLKKEHEKLASLTWRFSTAVSNVLEDELLPRARWATSDARPNLRTPVCKGAPGSPPTFCRPRPNWPAPKQ